MSKIEKFEILIPILNRKRTVRVLLPEFYFDDNNRSFSVLYMQDGQNLFDDNTAFGGQSWGVRECIDKQNIPLIVVGIDNGGENRRFEYSPWESHFGGELLGLEYDIGGEGDLYADFFVNILKKIIDKKYRTKSDFNNTYIAGSSMGALISLYITAKYPRIFSKVGCFSLASWVAQDRFLDYINSTVFSHNEKFYIYVGTRETSNDRIDNYNQIYMDCSFRLNDVLKSKGLSNDRLKFVLGENEIHNEISWYRYFPDFIKWLEIK